MDTNTIILAFIIVAIIIVVWMKYKDSTEPFINYYGFDSNILDKVCPSPWCGGGPVIRQPEDAMYPTLVSNDDATYNAIAGMNSEASQVAAMAGFDLLDDGLVNPSNNVKEVMAEWVKKQKAEDLKNAQAKKNASYGMNLKERFIDGEYGVSDLLDASGQIPPDTMARLFDNSVLGPDRFPSDGGDLLSGNEYGDARFVGFDNGYTGGRSYEMNQGIAVGIADSMTENFVPAHVEDGAFLGQFRKTMTYGTHRDNPKIGASAAEGFEAAPSASTYSYAGRYIYEHPDMDGFNQTYYANPSRTLGIAPERMAYTHFNEGVGYYARPQEMLAPSREAYPNKNDGVPYGRVTDLFDMSEKFSGAYVEDPRQVTLEASGMYKSRRDINDVVDLEMRRRNQISLSSAQHGGRMSNMARGIMSVVYSPEMYDATQNVWWEAYEP